jgi:hypothetical protein
MPLLKAFNIKIPLLRGVRGVSFQPNKKRLPLRSYRLIAMRYEKILLSSCT